MGRSRASSAITWCRCSTGIEVIQGCEPAFVARELAPAGLRSRPVFATAAQPSGSKLPRHKGIT
ncbi:hypothetical protein B1219_10545 [Pseudomonas ogarae]|nr:hypothetical protein B1219_10545 [Pseudomonas ogarae]